MNKRRGFLKSAPVVAAGLTGLGSTQSDAVGVARSNVVAAVTGATPIPNMTVVTHTGQMALFHDDLIQGRVVAISMMSIENESRYPVTASLARVADLLGDKLGRDVHFISVTRDPVADTPERLREFAARFGDRKGWTFVWPEPTSLNAIENRIYHHDRHGPKSTAMNHGVPMEDINPQRTLDVVFYGNSRIGLWSTFPVDISTEDAARRLSWVMPGKTPGEQMERGGPRVLTASGFWAPDNRMA